MVMITSHRYYPDLWNWSSVVK